MTSTTVAIDFLNNHPIIIKIFTVLGVVGAGLALFIFSIYSIKRMHESMQKVKG